MKKDSHSSPSHCPERFRTGSPLVFALFLFLALVTPALQAADSTVTKVFLVRHAEKAAVEGEGKKDPPLTEQGKDRARTLAHALGEAGVEVVYSTQFQRTRDTATPLAEALGLEVQLFEAKQGFSAAMAKKILADHRGQTVVVVSHSNTVPAILAELGFDPIPTIDEDEYDDLYVAVLPAQGQPTLLSLRYGSETP